MITDNVEFGGFLALSTLLRWEEDRSQISGKRRRAKAVRHPVPGTRLLTPDI